MMLLHGLLLRDSFQCFHLLTDTLVQIRYAHPDLLPDSADHFFLRIRKLKEVLIHGIGTAEVDLNQLLWAEKLLLLDESGTCGDVLDAIQDVLCLGRVRVLSPIKIYGSKEEIQARKSPETVDAPGFAPDASIPVTLYVIPQHYRFSNPRPENHNVRNDSSIFIVVSLYPQPLQAAESCDPLSAPSFG